ncbi:hypothetical protein CFC21_104558 [Triticum aestivum]|uniref:Uncharacterized protein n=3 Tax=Triticum TaxID=4564 RepID=A0A9R1MAV2_WHEAT|nr:uncharacterized protein LOC119341553 isoform X2 [Triticum dicoccoides]XP_044435978.1 uncharacterized protein LOC123162268 [Triticum aestivum]KAF7103578.1 hypothetical protein CFC21_104558 [Triticum aestivum]
MATALRHAAMRLGGGGAWAKLLPRRLVHGGARPAAAAAADGKTRALDLIKQKREELFDLIADTERRYDTRMTREGFQNTRMLQQLAVQIKPRPNDPLWRSKRNSKLANDYLGLTGACVAGYMFTKKWLHSDKEAAEETMPDPHV